MCKIMKKNKNKTKTEAEAEYFLDKMKKKSH